MYSLWGLKPSYPLNYQWIQNDVVKRLDIPLVHVIYTQHNRKGGRAAGYINRLNTVLIYYSRCPNKPSIILLGTYSTLKIQFHFGPPWQILFSKWMKKITATNNTTRKYKSNEHRLRRRNFELLSGDSLLISKNRPNLVVFYKWRHRSISSFGVHQDLATWPSDFGRWLTKVGRSGSAAADGDAHSWRRRLYLRKAASSDQERSSHFCPFVSRYLTFRYIHTYIHTLCTLQL